MDLLGRLREHSLIPVITLDQVADAQPLAEALTTGGLPVMEITLRSAAGLPALEKLAALGRPELILGAGTITHASQARDAVKAGAQFLVSPGFSRSVVEAALELGIPITPGIATPTDLMLALDYQLPAVKFFPAESYGGVKTLQALLGPFPLMQFVPTGGITLNHLAGYLALKPVIACGGSWMVEKSRIATGDWAWIAETTRAAVAQANSCRGKNN